MSLKFSFLKDIQVGVLFSTLLTFFLTFTFLFTIQLFAGFFAIADIYFVIGSVVGVLYVSKSLKEEKPTIKYGAATGLISSFLSSFFVSLYWWALISVNFGWDAAVFLILLIRFIPALIIGTIAGALTSIYFVYKDAKMESREEEYVGDSLFSNLPKE
jgi:hypothetical protein